MLYDLILKPFFDYDFMRTALIVCIALSLGSIPLGVFMVLKRMGLMGEALSHGILPGIAVAFLASGFSVIGMTIGGMVAGLIVVLLSQFITKKSILPYDSSLSALYIIFLSLGFLLISYADSGIHLTHILFGNVLAINNNTLLLIISLSIITIISLIFLIKPLLWASFDPTFCSIQKIPVTLITNFFMILVVLNIVASCQALGTLMALGMMLLPAITARLFINKFQPLLFVSILLGLIGSFLGIIISFHMDLSAGPTIILCLGTFFLISLSHVLK